MEGIYRGFPVVPETQGQNYSVDLVFCEKKQGNIPYFLVIGRHKYFALYSHLNYSRTYGFRSLKPDFNDGEVRKDL